MTCPNCAAPSPEGAAECPNCQIIFAKWALKRAAPAPAPAPASQPVPALAPPVELSAASRSGDTMAKLGAIVYDFPGGRMEYAGYWRRIAAMVLDGWISLIFLGILGLQNNLLLAWVFNCLYCTGLESSPWMATPGKKMLGLSVRDANGGKITFAAANKRYWAKPVWMGWVWLRCAFAFATRNRQIGVNAMLEKPFWHDRFAGTLVLKRA